MFQNVNPLDKSTAMLEIFIMVAGAALIGFFVGWLFQKLQRDKLKADLRFTGDKLNTLQGKSEASIKEQSELTRLVDDLRSRKDALFSELETQKSENAKLEERLTALPAQDSPDNKDLLDKIALLEKQRGELQTELENVNENSGDNGELEALRSDLKEAEARTEELKSQLKANESDQSQLQEIERLKIKLSASGAEQHRLRNQVETLSHNTRHRDEVNRLETVIENLKTEKNEIVANAQSVAAPAPVSNNEELQALKDEVRKLENQYKDLEVEYEELEDKLEERPLTPFDPTEVADLRIKVAALEDEKQTFQDRISKLEKLEPSTPEGSSSEDRPESPSTDNDLTLMDPQDSSLTYDDYQKRKKSLLKSVGKATEAEKDSFSKIVGIGPFIEAKLNSIGIFTYEQISRFSESDIDHVTRLIEFFPGRIERDGWVRQAGKLLKKRAEGDDEEEDI